MFESLSQVFNNFLLIFTSNNWCYIFLGLFIFIIVLNILCNLIKN